MDDRAGVIKFPRKQRTRTFSPEDQDKLDRLVAICNAQTKAILDDPLKYLSHMGGMVHLLRRAVEDATMELSGTTAIAMRPDYSNGPVFEHPEAALMRRNKKALETLDGALRALENYPAPQ